MQYTQRTIKIKRHPNRQVEMTTTSFPVDLWPMKHSDDNI